MRDFVFMKRCEQVTLGKAGIIVFLLKFHDFIPFLVKATVPQVGYQRGALGMGNEQFFGSLGEYPTEAGLLGRIEPESAVYFKVKRVDTIEELFDVLDEFVFLVGDAVDLFYAHVYHEQCISRAGVGVPVSHVFGHVLQWRFVTILMAAGLTERSERGDDTEWDLMGRVENERKQWTWRQQGGSRRSQKM